MEKPGIAVPAKLKKWFIAILGVGSGGEGDSMMPDREDRNHTHLHTFGHTVAVARG